MLGKITFIAGAIVAVTMLSACTSRKELVAQCQLEAARLYPGETLFSGDKISEYIKTCMQAKGHDWNDGNPVCQQAQSATFSGAMSTCYR
jgi:hypothetical protein